MVGKSEFNRYGDAVGTGGSYWGVQYSLDPQESTVLPNRPIPPVARRVPKSVSSGTRALQG